MEEKTIKDFITEEEFLVLRQHYENWIESAEEIGDDTTELEERLEDLDAQWYN